jgi:hypothetical protein
LVRAIERSRAVLEAVRGFVPDRRACRLLPHVGREPAALDHEAGDHAVEHRAVEVPRVDVVEEILRRQGRVLLEEFDREVAERGLESNHGGGPLR